MKNYTTAIVFISIIVVVGLYMYFGKPAKAPTELQSITETRDESTQTTEGTISGKFTGSMKDLVSRNQSVKCTFTQTTSVSSSSGTTYVAQGKVRSDFDVSASGQTFQAHMIADGQFSYVWSSVLPQGFKVSLTQNTNQKSIEPAQGVDYDQTLDYDCVPWTKDVSLFVPPTNIQFIIPSVPKTL